MADLEALRRRPLAFVGDLDRPELSDDDRRHLEKVLRLRTGDELIVGDGAGRWRPARFGSTIETTGPIEIEPVRSVPVVVGFAPVKGDRSELVVQKLTELGTDRIVPLTTERSVVRWDADRAARNLERHRRIVREAAMQSRNLYPPMVETMGPLDRFLARHPDATLADPAGDAPGSGFPPVLVVGPEGGFAPAELEGRSTVALPGRILRTETAAIVAGALAVAAHPVL